jgi:hypothetical protein
MAPASYRGSRFSLLGDGTKDMLTGSEEPSNQLASLSTAVAVLFFGADGSGGGVCPISNWDASATETLSGDTDLVLAGRRKGRKVEALVGEEECVLVNNGGKSVECLDC